MRPSCTCTTLEDHSGKVIPPGGSLPIDASLESTPYPGKSKVEIRFLFAGYDDVVALPITAVVSWAVRAEPAYFSATAEGAWMGTVQVTSIDGRPFSVISAGDREPRFVDGFDPGLDTPRTTYTLGWDLREFDNELCTNAVGERMPMWWVVETDHPDAPLVDVRVRHHPCCLLDMPTRGGRQWFLADNRKVLGTLQPNAPVEFETRLKWLRDRAPNDTIRAVESLSDQFDVELLEVRQDDDSTIHVRVRLTPSGDVRGLLYGNMRFYGFTNGHHQKLVAIGRVVDSTG